MLIIAKYPSKCFLPAMEKPYPLIVDFLKMRFPWISKQQWVDRINCGLVFFKNGEKITTKSLCVPLTMLLYFRTADGEIPIPFKEKIIYMDDNILAVNKPHFLPVMPAGKYINENLLTRLKDKTGNRDIVPVNRIDRETSGIVLFSSNKKTRGLYQSLFMQGKVEKTYYAITESNTDSKSKVFNKYLIESRIVTGDPWFTMKQETGTINARTIVNKIKEKNNKILFEIKPLTGKKHQIRIHLSSIGCKILNDRLYPRLMSEQAPDFQHPLLLQSKILKFSDPVTGRDLEFVSPDQLIL